MQANFLGWLPRSLPLTRNRTVFRFPVSGSATAKAEVDVLHGVMAMTRSGLPEPPTIFNGAAMTMAPIGGS
jgi:hypothetical protein